MEHICWLSRFEMLKRLNNGHASPNMVCAPLTKLNRRIFEFFLMVWMLQLPSMGCASFPKFVFMFFLFFNFLLHCVEQAQPGYPNTAYASCQCSGKKKSRFSQFTSFNYAWNRPTAKNGSYFSNIVCASCRALIEA